jgi:O-acetyl-ADP-ribose deacetylase (regulator of RNase III)
LRRAEYIINGRKLIVVYGSITDQETEVWVSSDDNMLSMSGGVSSSIRKIVGESVFLETRAVVPLEIGRVAVTDGGAKAGLKHVFHPSIVKGGGSKTLVKSSAIKSVALRCLELASSLGIKSIAFPAIGTGSAGVPYHIVAKALITAITEYLILDTSLETVFIALYAGKFEKNNPVAQAYEQAIGLAAPLVQMANMKSSISELQNSYDKAGMQDKKGKLDELSKTLKGKKTDGLKKDHLLHALDQMSLPKTAASDDFETLAGPAPDLDALRIQAQKTKLQGFYLILNIKTGKLNLLEIEQAVEGAAFTKQNELFALKSEVDVLEKQIAVAETKLKDMTPPITPENPTRGDDAPDQPDPKPNNAMGENYLFIIAVTDYIDFPDLPNAVKDANDVAQVLYDHYGFSKQRTYLLKDRDATAATVTKALENITTHLPIKEQDRLVIYYAGHGYYKKEYQEGYWLLSDARKSVGETSFLDTTKLLNRISKMSCQHVLLLADACFSASLFVERSVDLTEANPVIQRLNMMRSRWAIVSGRLEPVADGIAGENSPFAHKLIRYFKNPIDGKLFYAQQLATYLLAAVGNNSSQLPEGRPLHKAGDEGGQFVFAFDGTVIPTISTIQNTAPASPSRGTEPTKPAQPAQSLTPKEQIKQFIADDETRKALELLKKQIAPDGRHEDTVLILMGQLTRAEKEERNGTSTKEEVNRQKNRINQSIKSILDDLD